MTASVCPTTEGQRQLLERPESVTQIANALGCSRGLVSHWRRGRKLPGEAYRLELQRVFGIHRFTWDWTPGYTLKNWKRRGRR